MRGIDAMLLVGYAFGMAIGQVLFKHAALIARGRGGGLLAALMHTPSFYAALLLYAALTVVWVWILGRVPLTRAYPFVGLALVLTPLFGMLWFRESVGPVYGVAVALVLAGVLLLAWDSAG